MADTSGATVTTSPSARAAGERTAYLDVRDLKVHFPTDDGLVKAVDGLNFTVERGKTIGIVGESGSGKSVTSQGILGLHRRTRARASGQIWLDGEDLMTVTDERLRELRGNKMAMIFQDPLSALHPYYTIGSQIVEAIRVHHSDTSKSAAKAKAVDLLGLVGIPNPARRVDQYPHEFSGGMRQRAMIAMALANDPSLLIADEPTTALDVTIQAQILALLKELVEDTGTALIMITHDLGVVAGLCDEVNVLYGGRIVERGDRHPIFREPRHPYTNGLLGSIPRLDTVGERLTPIPGSVADNLPWDHACAFAPRCSQPVEVCTTNTPTLEESGRRALRCFNPVEVAR